jgi:nitrite reductase/ring-hydroxylating ferredoxin subunit
MAQWHRVAGHGDLEPGNVIRVEAAGRPLALVRDGDRYFALGDVCPHAGGPLSLGTVEDGKLVCPWHGREFDMSSGRCEGFDLPAATYPVESRADGIFVSV